MAFMANQWLTGVQRARGYSPIEVKLRAVAERDEDDGLDTFSRQFGIVAEVIATRANFDDQVLSVTSADLDTILPTLFREASGPTRIAVARDILTRMTDAEILSFLADVLTSRATRIATKQSDATA